MSLTFIADVLARIASADGGLSLFLCERNVFGVGSERWGGVTVSMPPQHHIYNITTFQYFPSFFPQDLNIKERRRLKNICGWALFASCPLSPICLSSGCRLLVPASLAASLFLYRTFAAHVLAQFTTRLLGEELSSPRYHAASRTLCGAFIFVCRQIYNTCEGLQVLQPYGLHWAIAAAWRKVRTTTQQELYHRFFCSPGQTYLGSGQITGTGSDK